MYAFFEHSETTAVLLKLSQTLVQDIEFELIAYFLHISPLSVGGFVGVLQRGQ